MIKDRGTMKWTAMMLPEHTQVLRDIWQSDQKVTKPLLDEQELEEINLQLMEALNFNLEVTLSYYANGYINTSVGIIQSVNTNSQEIKIEDTAKKISHIKFDAVTNIKVHKSSQSLD
ncbi:YolD-like family protein [Bacillus sp. Marseille-P3661]|uniref:YolD-like family protein n=1 Tax=Bacillus sp. Marseille-P3661 TaxID=1936234 RepID=UPI000C82B067|nr:YolD-like family protein [Bacillus sp. Marseille-P3661]